MPAIPPQMDAIGGYFPLEPLGRGAPGFHASGHSLQSGRAAFLALLEATRPARVWLPWYLCDSMAEPPAQTGIEVRRYALNPDFSMAPIELGPGDLLVGVNYFGLLDDASDRLILRYPPSQVVLDNSQAFYARPRACLASIYSPRKFFGVPDGGYLIAPGMRIAEYPQDASSQGRSVHLYKRRQFGAEAGYADFAAAERSLSDQPALRMSAFTQGLMAQIPHDEVQRRRRRNFLFMKQRLDEFNQLEWSLREDTIPLCYPFLPRVSGLRQALWQARIYAACYWPELLDPARPVPPTERLWAANLLALPIDQRYDTNVLEEHVVLPLVSLLSA